MKADDKTVNAALRSIEEASSLHPTRLLARHTVAQFRLDREKGTGLPVATRTSGSGAPLLDVNAVLKRTLPGSLGKR